MNLDERIDKILRENAVREYSLDADTGNRKPLYPQLIEQHKQLIRECVEYVKPEDWYVEVVRSRRSGGKQVIETAVKTEGSEHIFEIPLDRYDDFVRVKVVRKSMEDKIKDLGL